MLQAAALPTMPQHQPEEAISKASVLGASTVAELHTSPAASTGIPCGTLLHEGRFSASPSPFSM